LRLMRLKDKGHPGPGGMGDGIVLISVSQHPFFSRDGDNIRMDLPLTIDEAVRGAKVKCPTVDGPVMLTIKPGTNSGTVMRLAGKGWTRKGEKTPGGEPARGDQLVTLEIHLPKDLAKFEERLDGWVDPARVRDKFGL
jgi:DnaJ-class molecular chaperone